MDYRQEVGSYTAKGGFENEADIVIKFEDYKNDSEAQIWLEIMGYDYNKIQKLTAKQIPPRINKDTALSLGVTESNFEETTTFKKADIQIRLEIIIDDIYHIENLSLKKANVGALASHFNIFVNDRHRAFGDAIATAKILNELLQIASR